MKIKRVEHIAIAVHNLAEVMKIFEGKLGLSLEYEENFPQYSTRIAMYPVGQTYIELLEGYSESSEVSRWIGDKGQGLYHICFEVEDIDSALAEMKAKGVRLIDETPRAGHGGSRIAFIDPKSTANVLVELAELPAAKAHG